MTLNQLLYFCAVARAGSYSRAAEEFNVSEPVVYRAIRTLEKQCGLGLLERIGKRVCLTSGGRAIYDYAVQIASLTNLTSQALIQHKGVGSGRISIGGDTTISSSLLPDVLAEWIVEHPNVDISIIQGRKQEFENLLLEDRLDLLLSSSAKQTPGLGRKLIFTESLVVVCVSDYPLAKSGVVSLAELSKERMILPSRGTPIRDDIEQVEYQYGVQFRFGVEVNRQHTIKRLCEKGVGVAMLPMSIVNEDVAAGKLRVVNVEAFPRSRPYFLVYRADKVLTPEICSLVSAI